jgi:hypothetical protein
MGQFNDVSAGSLQSRVEALMPELTAQLKDLIAVPSVSLPGYPESTHAALADGQHMVTELFRDAGAEPREHRPARHRARGLRRDPRPAWRTDRPDVQPLRRGAGR